MIKSFFRVFKRKLHPNYNLFIFIISVIIGLFPIFAFFEFLKEDENEVSKGLVSSCIIFSLIIFLHLALSIMISGYDWCFYAYTGLGVFGIILNFMNWFRLAIWEEFMSEVKDESKTSED